MRSEKEIIEMFKAAVLEVDNKKKMLDQITPTTELSALGLDSVQTMEVIGAMEERLNVQFPDEDLATLKSIGDLTRLVQRLG
jgi:acyl carrier protein